MCCMDKKGSLERLAAQGRAAGGKIHQIVSRAIYGTRYPDPTYADESFNQRPAAGNGIHSVFQGSPVSRQSGQPILRPVRRA